MMIPAAGDEIPVLQVEITREDLVRYAGAADDYVRQHWDHPFMIASGFPDVAVHGWLTFAHMCRAVTDWLSPDEWRITSYAVRYVRPIYPGVLRCGGNLAEVKLDRADLVLWAKDDNDNVTTQATMTVMRRMQM